MRAPETRPGVLLAALAVLLTPAAGGAAVTVIGDVNPNPVIAAQDVEIGRYGYGEVAVDGGTQLATNRTTFGDFSGLPDLGVAVARVRGAGSTWYMQELDMRQPIAALLEVSDGGQMQIGYAHNNESLPEIRVTGDNSVLSIGDRLTSFGSSAAIDLSLTDGGRLLAGDFYFSEGARAELDAGVLACIEFENGGRIAGDGSIEYARMNTVGNYGVIEVGDQQLLSFQSYEEEPLLNTGKIEVAGGELDAIDGLWNLGSYANPRPAPTPSITLDDAVLRVGPSEQNQGQYLVNDGRLASVGGVSSVHGAVLGFAASSIAATNSSVLVFHDPVALQGATLSVFAGSRAVFLDDLVLENSTLFAQLPGDPGLAGFGVAEVVGELAIDGEVQFTLASGYTPQAGDVFPLATASGGVTGEPSLAAAPPLADGLMWSLQTTGNTLALAVIETLPGDFNADGVVDAADYTVWRDNLDAAYQPSDLQTWRDNYGATIAAALPNNNAAPEPGAALLLLAGAVAGSSLRVKN